MKRKKERRKARKEKRENRERRAVNREPKRIDLDMSELDAILERAKAALSEEEYEKLRGAMETLLFLTRELEKKKVSVQRLKKMLFGVATEKSRKVLERILEESGTAKKTSGDEGSVPPEEKTKGHGRNSARAYTGAAKVKVSHESLKEGDPCPKCPKGKLYKWTPGLMVRVTGQAPLGATVYELEKLRCNLCGEIFTASAPDGVGEDRYDAESASMMALLKYGSGLPFNRLERLQEGLGIPLPASTQWDIVESASCNLAWAWEELIRQAAQGEVLHNDDTAMKILGLSKDDFEDGRKGVFTSAIVSKLKERLPAPNEVRQAGKLALFFTGRRHAGENLFDLLKRRSSELDKPIQMCDALSRNMPEELQTIVANCLAHGRRRFVDVAESFPEECVFVLKVLKDVYRNESIAKAKGMSADERLRFHQAESGPRMSELEEWMAARIDERKVEPNSGLGEAIAYMQKHWDKLTLFLREPGAPLDNNICERALKKSILNRKNAYFFKTLNGARVGDLFMSLIHTCELNGANPFDYLTELQKRSEEAAASPGDWMPWNYRRTIENAAVPKA